MPAGGQDTAIADASLFVALLVGEDHPLIDEALPVLDRVQAGELRLILTPVVVAEIAHVCRARLGMSRQAIAEVLAQLMDARGVDAMEPAAVRAAIELFRKQPRLSFPDAYLAGLSISAGPALVASLDRDFDAIDGLQRIPQVGKERPA